MKHLLIVLLALALSACGFQLRGLQQSAQTDIASVFLRISAAARVGAEVKAQLQGASIEIAASPEAAQYSLSLSKEELRRSVLSVSASTGKVDEYQLVLSVEMRIAKSGQDALLASETLSVSRAYAFDEDAVLGKAAEESLLEEELIRQAAGRILRSLRALSR